MKANINLMSNKLYAIQDGDGRFADKHSIWYEKDTDRWHYTSKGGYRFDSSMQNLDTGVTLCNSIEEAERVIEGLKDLLHKVNLQKTFFVVPIE